MDLIIQKNELRKRMTEARGQLSPEERKMRSEAACRHAADWLAERGPAGIMVYIPFRSELNTGPLIEWAWERGLPVIVPKIVQADRSMRLYRLDGWEGLTAGAYGIMEPDPARCLELAPCESPDVIFVPGLAFDRHGGRLGYGGGYYDRFAERLQSAGKGSPIWIGLSYELQLVGELPMQRHDRRMDGIGTENGLLVFSQRRADMTEER